jgi:hypothetical protein
MVPGRSGSYKKLEKRPANAGLFIVFGGGGTIIPFLLLFGLSCWRRNMAADTDEQDDYFCLRGILHREGAGRSWAMNNTSNISGVK